MSVRANRIITPLIVAFILVAAAPTFAGSIIYVNTDVMHSENHQDYAPEEIIIKFRDPTVRTLGENTFDGPDVAKLDLSGSLGKLNKKFRLSGVKRLFKNFKANKERTKALLEKDKALLTKREKHILQRLKRAPEKATVPALDRIYKLQFDLEPGQFIRDVLDAYNNDPSVEYAELNYIVTIDATPNDPYFPLQWSLQNTGQMYPESGKYNDPPGTVDADIDAPEAWDIQTGSGDIIVAVADTGVDYNHRDIDDNMWTDSNGYHGYDFLNNDNYPVDDHGHGTHCAGIISAEGNNGLDITGVCWNVKVMALKSMDENGSGTYADAAEAFYYAVNNGADVISNSWSSNEYSQTMQNAIDYAYSQGVVIVGSAGNRNSSAPRYPANNDHVIAVAATNSLDEKASFSNYGDWVDIAAPGVDSLSLRASGSDAGTPYDSYTTIMSGTSMSCPHVAGACGLLLANNPTLMVDNVCDILLAKADPIAPGICHSNGRLNLEKALNTVNLDRNHYRCSDEINITLVDFDREGDPNLSVSLEATGGDYETVVLESGSNPWLFTTAVLTEMAVPVVEDGVLQVSHGQTITVSYEDPNDGTGNPSTETDHADIDCQCPVISNVQIDTVTCRAVIIKFETDEPSTARIRCGVSCGGPYTIIAADPQLTTNHSVIRENLESGTDYYFVIDANDIAGNHTTDNNNDQCYQFTTTDEPSEIYVPDDYPTIQEAIDAAIDCTAIIVADGIYTGPGNRSIDFKGKVITLRSENGPENCIIDCQGSGRAFYFKNYEERTSILDGFTITNGYTDGKGGGIKCYIGSPTIQNCIISNCRAGQRNKYHCGGAGVHILYSNPRFINCVIRDNYGFNHGGMLIGAGNVDIINCVIVGNRADYVSDILGDFSYGGGICFSGSNVLIKNCLIANNWSSKTAGGLDCNRGSVKIINCTIVNNSAGQRCGGLSRLNNSNITITNSIVWGNQAPVYPQLAGGVVSYSDVQDGYSGIGNINLDPCFVYSAGDDYYLSQIAAGQAVDSPCVDAGSDTAANLGMDKFTTRTDEIMDMGNVDMGYHYATRLKSPDIDDNLHVDQLDYGWLAADWQNCSEESYLPGDITKDSCVNGKDLKVLVEFWLDCFMTKATNPQPANEARGVDPNGTLSWAPGGGALFHDVYFGTDADAVTNAGYLSPEFMGTFSGTNFDPCGLEWETTYYWRIDEVGPACTTQGEVWTFTTYGEPDSHLVGLWKFDEGSGTIAYDSAGENDGTIYGAAWTTGQIDGALSFDGVDDYVVVSDSDSISLGNQDYTICAWIYQKSIPPELNLLVVVSKVKDGSDKEYFFSVYNSGLRLDVEMNGNNQFAHTTTSPVTVNSWHFIVVAFDSSGITPAFYHNGQFQPSDNIIDTLPDSLSDDLYIGLLGGTYMSYPFDGTIDDVRIYDRALTTGEIEQLYQNALIY